MTTPEPDPTVRKVAQRIRSRSPSALTGSERRLSEVLVDVFSPEFYALHRRIGGVEERLDKRIGEVEERLDGRIDGLEAKVDRLGAHMIDRLGDVDAKLDRLLNIIEEGQTQDG